MKIKRMFLGLLAVVMVFSMVSCGSKSVKEQLVGTWKRDNGDDYIAFYEDGNVTPPSYYGVIKNWDYIDEKIVLVGAFRTFKFDLEIIDDDTIEFDDHEWTRIDE